MPATRRSTRQRIASQRFAQDASVLIDLSDAEASVPDPVDKDEGHSHNSLPPARNVDAIALPASESASGDRDDEIEDGVSDVELDLSDESARSGPLRKGRKERGKKKRSDASAKITKSLDDVLHSRGLSTSINRINRSVDILKMIVGPDKKEQQRLQQTIDFWYGSSCLPSREKIATAMTSGRLQENIAHQSGPTSSDPWLWCQQPRIKRAMHQLQSATPMTVAEGRSYYPPRHPTHKAVLGPPWHQTLFELKLQRSLHLSETWKPARDAEMDTDGAENEATSSSHLERNGWILNLGRKVQHLSWVPHREKDTQYLAVILDHPEPSGSDARTAFEPSVGYKSSIQIWSFKANSEDKKPKGLDPATMPALALVICTNWGMCTEVKWSPIARTQDVQSGGHKEHLGLAATVWSDGHIRILDITVPIKPDPRSIHRKSNAQVGMRLITTVMYNRAIFTAKPPQAICTTVAWASSKDIIGGCADGRVILWDISQHLDHLTSSAIPQHGLEETSQSLSNISSSPAPYLTSQLHDGYILSADTCHPLYPHLLVTLSTDGYYRLCDLRSPEFDTVESQRGRLYPSSFDFCPHFNAIVAPDSFEVAHFLWLRRFYTEQELVSCDGHIGTVACGRAHPYALFGCADGSVLAVNLATRVVKERKALQRFEMVWFRHEWRPEQAANGMHVQPKEGLPPAGISRITEAFQPRRKLKKNEGKKGVRSARGESGASAWETIHQEPTSITHVAWNPNPHCGAWAAAGMGSGLLRVEDLAV